MGQAAFWPVDPSSCGKTQAEQTVETEECSVDVNWKEMCNRIPLILSSFKVKLSWRVSGNRTEPLTHIQQSDLGMMYCFRNVCLHFRLLVSQLSF